jgi:hypothetical protein
MQKGYIELFNRTLRENILNAYLFEDIQKVQISAEKLVQDYNYRRPKEALNWQSPMQNKQKTNFGYMENYAYLPYIQRLNNNNNFYMQSVV